MQRGREREAWDFAEALENPPTPTEAAPQAQASAPAQAVLRPGKGRGCRRVNITANVGLHSRARGRQGIRRELDECPATHSAAQCRNGECIHARL